MDFGIARSTGRDGQGAAPGARSGPPIREPPRAAGRRNDGGRHRRHRRIHGARAGQGAGRRSAGRHLRVRPDPLRHARSAGAARSAPTSAIAELQGRMRAAAPRSSRGRHRDPGGDRRDHRSAVSSPTPPSASRRPSSCRRRWTGWMKTASRCPSSGALTRRAMAAAAVLVLLLLGGTFYVTQWLSAPPIEHDPVPVVIADFQNTHQRSDLRQHRSEQTLRRALEDAELHHRVSTAAGFAPRLAWRRPRSWTKWRRASSPSSRVSASSSPGRSALEGSGYDISVKATQPMTGNVITTADEAVRRARTRFSTRWPRAGGARPQGARRRDVGVGAAVRDEEPVDDFARRGQSLRGCRRSAIEGQGRGGAEELLESRASSIPSSASAIRAWP